MSHETSTGGGGAAGSGPVGGDVAIRPRRVAPVPVRRIADAVDAQLLGADPSASVVTGLTLATRSVQPGDLYAALPGARTHGARFAAQAVRAGAAALITDAAGAPDCAATGRPVLVHERPRGVLGDLARLVYADPAARVSTIGVTGTQGKTTVTYLLEAGLKPSGEPSAVIGTTGTRIDGRPVHSALTTPEAPDLHALFGVMADHGVTRCAMEVSSHALVQGRVDGLVFDVAVFLNLGRDHLDFHTDLEDYFGAKASLFTPARAKQAVIDVDDPYGRRLVELTELEVTTISAHGQHSADWCALDVQATAAGSRFTLIGPNGQRGTVQVPLPGAFNVSNALAAIVALVRAGQPLSEVLVGIAASPVVPGRMEQVDAGQACRVVVDYAHKPDAVQAVLQALRPTTPGRLTIVLGAGGDRDPGKRALMGAVASRLADRVVVTDDNPRTEEPASIRAEVLGGARSSGGTAELVEVGDRRAAIAHALADAGCGDCVVVAGKGHESVQDVQGTVYTFDDRVVVRQLLEHPRESS